jgi:hypothetical protein
LIGEVDVLDRNACFRILLGVDQARFFVSDHRIFGFHHQGLDLRDRGGCHRVCLDEITEKRQKIKSQTKTRRPRIDRYESSRYPADGLEGNCVFREKINSDAQKPA